VGEEREGGEFDLEAHLESLLAEMDEAEAQGLGPGHAAAAPHAAASVDDGGPAGEDLDVGEASDWDTAMRIWIRDYQWDPFLFTWKDVGPGKLFGAIQATCPFHRLSVTTKCTKTMNLPGKTIDDALKVVWTLRHWCNRAGTYHRQRFHIVPRRLNFKNTPDPQVLYYTVLFYTILYNAIR
jgi:hypothetical protein